MPFALRHHYRFPVFSPVQYEVEIRDGYETVTIFLITVGVYMAICGIEIVAMNDEAQAKLDDYIQERVRAL